VQMITCVTRFPRAPFAGGGSERVICFKVTIGHHHDAHRFQRFLRMGIGEAKLQHAFTGLYPAYQIVRNDSTT